MSHSNFLSGWKSRCPVWALHHHLHPLCVLVCILACCGVYRFALGVLFNCSLCTEAGSLTELWTCQFNWYSSVGLLSGAGLCFPHFGIIGVMVTPLTHGSRDPNSGPQACTANHLSMNIFFWKKAKAWASWSSSLSFISRGSLSFTVTTSESLKSVFFYAVVLI